MWGYLLWYTYEDMRRKGVYESVRLGVDVQGDPSGLLHKLLENNIDIEND